MTVSLQEKKETYENIVKFYDLAEELVHTVEATSNENAEDQLKFVEPLVVQISEATDYLLEEYANFVETDDAPGIFKRRRIEKAFADIKQALEKIQRRQEGK